MSGDQFFGIRDVLNDLGRRIDASADEQRREIQEVKTKQSELERSVNDTRLEITKSDTKTKQQIEQLRNDFATVSGVSVDVANLRTDFQLLAAKFDDFRADQKKNAEAAAEAEKKRMEASAAAEKERTKRTSIWAGVIGGAVSTVVTVVTVIANSTSGTEIPVQPPPANFAPISYEDDVPAGGRWESTQEVGDAIGEGASEFIEYLSSEVAEGSGD